MSNVVELSADSYLKQKGSIEVCNSNLIKWKKHMKLSAFIKSTFIALVFFLSSGILAWNTGISDGPRNEQEYQTKYFQTRSEAMNFCSGTYTHCISIEEVIAFPKSGFLVTYYQEYNPGVCKPEFGCKG